MVNGSLRDGGIADAADIPASTTGGTYVTS